MNNKSFGILFVFLVILSFACLFYSLSFLAHNNLPASLIKCIVLYVLAITMFAISGGKGFDKNKYKTASFFGLVGFIFTLASIIIVITPNSYVVMVNTDGYRVFRDKINFINPIDRIKSEEVRIVPRVVEEKKFYELKTNSYDFIKFEVVSELQKVDDYHIYIASRDSYPGNAGYIKELLTEILKSGEKDKKIIAKEVLRMARADFCGYWAPKEIKIISLSRVKS